MIFNFMSYFTELFWSRPEGIARQWVIARQWDIVQSEILDLRKSFWIVYISLYGCPILGLYVHPLSSHSLSRIPCLKIFRFVSFTTPLPCIWDNLMFPNSLVWLGNLPFVHLYRSYVWYLFIINIWSEVMKFHIQVFCSWPVLVYLGHFQGTGIILKYSTVHLCLCRVNGKSFFLHLI